MNGPEQYRKAETLLAVAFETADAIPGTKALTDRAELRAAVDSLIAAAQVHATLAVAAATASEQASRYDGDEYAARSRGWAGVA